MNRSTSQPGFKKVTKDVFNKSNNMKIIIHFMFKLILGSLFLFTLSTNSAFGQNCPSFEIKEVKNIEGNNESGEVVIKIDGSKQYSLENFQIRQKQNQVTAPIGYELDVKITKRQLKISGLRKSEELYLDEYVVLFSDQSCDNSAVIEVGTFKIK